MKTLAIEPVSGGSAGSQNVAYRRRCQIPLPSKHRPLWLKQTAKRDTLNDGDTFDDDVLSLSNIIAYAGRY